MKKFIKEYINIIAVSITGFVFVLTSFYFVMNYYHSEELKKQIYIGQNDAKLTEYKKTVDKIKSNLASYQNKKIINNNNLTLYSDLSACSNILTENYYNMETNRYYSAHDVYSIGNNLQSNILNVCWALHLSSIKESSVKTFKNVSPFVANEINSISTNTANALNEIMNNSSYFYTTRTTSITIRDYLTSDYNTIADSYQNFANIVLYLSELLNEGGNND